MKAKKKPVKTSENYIFMSKVDTTVSDLKDVLEAAGKYDIQLWPEAGVLEVVLGEKASLDCEELSLELGDEYSDAFIKEHEIKSLFYLTVPSEVKAEADVIITNWLANIDAMLCADTDDFQPIRTK